MEPAIPALATQRFRLAEIRPDDAGDVRQLFERIFNKPMSAAFWDWKYRQSGGCGIGVWDRDILVGHYGGTGVTVLFEGRPVPAVQVCDVMVDNRVRHVARRLSPYFLATSTFLEHFLGQGQRYLLAYGFPSNRHLALGVHLGLYAEVGTMSEVKISAPQPRIGDWLYRWQPLTIDDTAQWQGQVERLWQAMAQSLPAAAMVVKNAARLNYRYLQNPEQRYHLWLLTRRLTGTPLALVVVKEEAERILVMDVIGDRRRLETVLRMTSVEANRRWQKPLMFWLSTVQADTLDLPGIEQTPLPISTPANIWTDSPAPERLRDRWWLTAGDTDYL
ncbi:MAG TPA: GNAT family N-acetyltransferase [Candidatus Acidoferrum sp.]|nr:GNAT family N-acetyltransferase [Candidatus Acidoferrum sp.]